MRSSRFFSPLSNTIKNIDMEKMLRKVMNIKLKSETDWRKHHFAAKA